MNKLIIGSVLMVLAYTVYAAGNSCPLPVPVAPDVTIGCGTLNGTGVVLIEIGDKAYQSTIICPAPLHV